jgi:hypothetical protein
VFFVRKKKSQALAISARDMTASERKRYEKGKSSISKARSYPEIGEFWDKHDLSDYWSKTRKVKFDVVLELEATYYPVAKDLSEKIQSEARKQGVSSDTLVNLWLEQKIKEHRPSQGAEIVADQRVVRNRMVSVPLTTFVKAGDRHEVF